MGSDEASARRRPGLRRDDSFISIGSFYGELRDARGHLAEQEAIPLPPFHWELLEGSSTSTGRGVFRERQKVILLHGWHQVRFGRLQKRYIWGRLSGQRPGGMLLGGINCPARGTITHGILCCHLLSHKLACAH